jgi:hypothetical protein
LSIELPNPDVLSVPPSGWGEYGLAVGVLGGLTAIGLALPESAYQAQLFKKFVRGEAARAGGLVAAQGGTVAFDENPGGGARFTIYLPHVPPQAGDSE